MVAIETINGVKRVKAVATTPIDDGQDPTRLRRSGAPRRVIADIDVAEQMIKHFIHKVHGGKMRAWLP